jgi:hypothetical protein
MTSEDGMDQNSGWDGPDFQNMPGQHGMGSPDMPDFLNMPGEHGMAIPGQEYWPDFPAFTNEPWGEEDWTTDMPDVPDWIHDMSNDTSSDFEEEDWSTDMPDLADEDGWVTDMPDMPDLPDIPGLPEELREIISKCAC